LILFGKAAGSVGIGSGGQGVTSFSLFGNLAFPVQDVIDGFLRSRCRDDHQLGVALERANPAIEKAALLSSMTCSMPV
jgi:hypothetical protein